MKKPKFPLSGEAKLKKLGDIVYMGALILPASLLGGIVYVECLGGKEWALSNADRVTYTILGLGLCGVGSMLAGEALKYNSKRIYNLLPKIMKSRNSDLDRVPIDSEFREIIRELKYFGVAKRNRRLFLEGGINSMSSYEVGQLRDKMMNHPEGKRLEQVVSKAQEAAGFWKYIALP